MIALASLALLLPLLYTALMPHPPLVMVLDTLDLLTAFISLYIWLLFQVIPPQVSSATLCTKGALGALVALAITMNLTFPQDLHWGVLFFYLAVAAGFAFLLRHALLAVGGSIVLALSTLLVMRPAFSADLQQHLG